LCLHGAGGGFLFVIAVSVYLIPSLPDIGVGVDHYKGVVDAEQMRLECDLRASNLGSMLRKMELERYIVVNWLVPTLFFLTRYPTSRNDPWCIDLIRAAFTDFR